MWTYILRTGAILDPDGAAYAIGYAGHGEGKNNPDMQDVADTGPVPVGTYTLGKPRNDIKLGPYAIPLIPDGSNQMFGRDGFYIHGDSVSHPGQASCGCICLSPEELRQGMYDSPDHVLEVRAQEG